MSERAKTEPSEAAKCEKCKGLGDIQTESGTHICGDCLGTGIARQANFSATAVILAEKIHSAYSKPGTTAGEIMRLIDQALAEKDEKSREWRELTLRICKKTDEQRRTIAALEREADHRDIIEAERNQRFVDEIQVRDKRIAALESELQKSQNDYRLANLEATHLRIKLTTAQEQIKELRDVLEESLALNINYHETTEEGQDFEEARKVIRQAKAALSNPIAADRKET